MRKRGREDKKRKRKEGEREDRVGRKGGGKDL